VEVPGEEGKVMGCCCLNDQRKRGSVRVCVMYGGIGGIEE
jgi:hypothetical protein